jgi:hypothetical protein
MDGWAAVAAIIGMSFVAVCYLLMKKTCVSAKEY